MEFSKVYYESLVKNHSKTSSYVDILKLLFVVSNKLQPENYLEIGVRRGRSMSMVVSNAPNVSLYCFDMWVKNYFQIEQFGEAFVRKEMKNIGHLGNINFFNGDSKKTLPIFFKQNPNLYFDLICVDGDHSYHGSKSDLLNIVNRVKIGGAIIFDDINSEEHPFLLQVWKKYIMSRDDFSTVEFNEHGLGVGLAIRKY